MAPNTHEEAHVYQLCAVEDQWSELLPTKIPLRYSFFRYLGFRVTTTKNGKIVTLKGRQVGYLKVTISNEGKHVFSDKIQNSFKNGVFYVQDIKLENPGLHTISIKAEGSSVATKIPSLELRVNVFEFMLLEDFPDLLSGPYGALRGFVESCHKEDKKDSLRDDKMVDSFIKSNRNILRVVDMKWWFKAFVEHSLDREQRQKELQKKTRLNGESRKRKQMNPIRSGDKREHENFFDRRPREWKRVKNGEIRVFTMEPLYGEFPVFSGN